MAKAYTLLEQAAEYRDLANRAKRLAATVANHDGDRLLTYAKELEAQAASLDKQAQAAAKR